METGTRTWMLAVVCAVTGCYKPPPAQEPQGETAAEPGAAAPNAEPGAEPGAAPGTSPAPSAAPTAAASAAPGSEFAVPSVADVCEKLCVRADKHCNKDSAIKCRASCDHYVKIADQCENDVRRALQCQQKAKDELLCSAQADPKCTREFKGLEACEKGEKAGGQNTARDFALPTSWTKVQDDQLKFTVMMPPGAALDPKAPRRTWQGEDGGITYFVSQVDAPKGKPDKSFLKMAVAYVGGKCQMGMKLHGRFESKGKLMMQFDSYCPDKTEYHGAIHIWNDKAVVTAFRAPPGSKGVLEPFFYSLQRTD
jgi:hypothetical protein